MYNIKRAKFIGKNLKDDGFVVFKEEEGFKKKSFNILEIDGELIPFSDHEYKEIIELDSIDIHKDQEYIKLISDVCYTYNLGYEN